LHESLEWPQATGAHGVHGSGGARSSSARGDAKYDSQQGLFAKVLDNLDPGPVSGDCDTELYNEETGDSRYPWDSPARAHHAA